jgi:hypothetical protein
MFEVTRHVGGSGLPALSRGPTSRGWRPSALGARRSYARVAWVCVNAVLLVVMAAVGAHAQAQATDALILGVIERIAVDDMNDPASAGRLVVQGKEITIPRGLAIGLPTGEATLRTLVLEAPEECKAQEPPQSGLASSDSCLNGGAPALARVVASSTESGGLVATVVMVQKDSSRTLARMKAESPRAARARVRNAQRLSERKYQ